MNSTKIDYKKLTINQLEDEVMRLTEVMDFYRIRLALDKKKSDLYRQLHHSQDELQRINFKGDLSQVELLLDIALKRETEFREENNRFNWKFRAIAKNMLEPATYNEIAERAKGGGGG